MRTLAVLLALVASSCGSGPPPACEAPPAIPSVAPWSPPGEPLAPMPSSAVSTAPRDPAVALVMEGASTCAVQASGAVTCWGGSFTMPRRIAGWRDIAKLVFTRKALCGLHRDGRVDCGHTDGARCGDAVRGDAVPIAMYELQGVTAAVDLVTYGDTVCVRERAGEIGCWIDGEAPRVTRTGLRGATTLWMGQWDAPEYQYAGSLYACALVRGRLACVDLVDDRPVGEHDAPAGASPRLQITAPRVFRRFAGITEPLVRGTKPGRNGMIGVQAARGPARCGRLYDEGGAPTDPEQEPELPESCMQRDGAIDCGFPGGPGAVHVDHVTQLASWGCHACAIHGAGAVACWGSDEECELGRGGCDRRADLVPARGLRDAVGLAEGIDERTVFALRANGQLAFWGHGWRASAAVPTTFSSVTDAVQLVSSDGFVCVLRRGDGVACWGPRSHGDRHRRCRGRDRRAKPVEQRIGARRAPARRPAGEPGLVARRAPRRRPCALGRSSPRARQAHRHDPAARDPSAVAVRERHAGLCARPPVPWCAWAPRPGTRCSTCRASSMKQRRSSLAPCPAPSSAITKSPASTATSAQRFAGPGRDGRACRCRSRYNSRAAALGATGLVEFVHIRGAVVSAWGVRWRWSVRPRSRPYFGPYFSVAP